MVNKSCQPDSDRHFKNGHIPNSTTPGEREAEEFYNNLIRESPYISGDKEPFIPAKEIPWLEPELLKEGIDFGRKYIFSVAIANTFALFYGFSVKPESIVLLRSGKFHESENSFRRYLSTARRIATWYYFGLTNSDSLAYDNIKIVRKLHSHYAKSQAPLPPIKDMERTEEKSEIIQAMRKDLEFLDTSDAPEHLLTWDPPLPFSQFDMALTQFGFIGMAYLYPQSLGIKDVSKMRGFIHFWAVIGRLLGLEDRFNLALHASPELFQKIYTNVAMASLKSPDERVICLQNALIQGLSKRLFLVTLKSWMYAGLVDVEGYEGEHLWSLMSLYDKICVYVLRSSMKIIYHSGMARTLSNAVTVILLQIAYYVYLPDTALSLTCPFKLKEK